MKDEMDKFKFNNDFNNMNKFKFNNNDLKAFNILGISVGLKWEKVQEKRDAIRALRLPLDGKQIRSGSGR